MAQRKLLTNGSAFLRTDGRWAGVVWYMDERGERKRKSFSGTTKAEVNKKMVDYVGVRQDGDRVRRVEENARREHKQLAEGLQVPLRRARQLR